MKNETYECKNLTAGTMMLGSVGVAARTCQSLSVQDIAEDLHCVSGGNTCKQLHRHSARKHCPHAQANEYA